MSPPLTQALSDSRSRLSHSRASAITVLSQALQGAGGLACLVCYSLKLDPSRELRPVADLAEETTGVLVITMLLWFHGRQV